MSDTRTTPVKKILDKAKIILSDCELNNDELISLLGGVVSDLVMGYDLGFTEEEFSGHVPSGVNKLELPDNYARVTQLFILDPENLESSDLSSGYERRDVFSKCRPFPEYQPCGKPCNWTIIKGCLVFDRPFDRPYILKMCYIPCADEVTSIDDSINFPPKFCDVVVDALVVRIHMMNDDYDKAAMVQGQLDGKIVRMTRDDAFDQMAEDDVIPTVWGYHG